jgi:hypothetical protein
MHKPKKNQKAVFKSYKSKPPRYPMINEKGQKLAQGWGVTQGSVKDLITQDSTYVYLVDQNGRKLSAQ